MAISFPEPTCLLVSTKTPRILVLTKRHVGSGNEIAKVPKRCNQTSREKHSSWAKVIDETPKGCHDIALLTGQSCCMRFPLDNNLKTCFPLHGPTASFAL